MRQQFGKSDQFNKKSTEWLQELRRFIIRLAETGSMSRKEYLSLNSNSTFSRVVHKPLMCRQFDNSTFH